MVTPTTPLKAIRAHCLDCSHGSHSEVRHCTVTNCTLYTWRFGKHPYREKRQLSDEQRQALANRLKNAREAKQRTEKQAL